MKKTIGIVAHVDAGKTTFSEQILYATKVIRNKGRVDHKNTLLDNHYIEKERGITIFSDIASFDIGDSKYYLVDTPGHMDFSSEMERALSILDYAILIVSGVEGIQAHTENIWNLLRKYNIPTFFFINKSDREGFDIDKVISSIKNNLTENIVLLDNDYLNNEEVIEFICEKDDALLEKYFEGTYELNEVKNTFKELIASSTVFPCFMGSALQDVGIEEFLNSLEDLSITNYKEEDEFSGRIYKITYDEKGNRLTFIKALSGKIKVRDEFNFDDTVEKISSIRFYNGNKFITADEAGAGDIFAVTGLSKSKAGQGIGTLKDDFKYEVTPTLISKVIYDESINIKDILHIFKILNDEDPSLHVNWNETLKEIQVSIMGKIQLEILKEVVKERFNMDVDFGPCNIIYKETIDNKVIGSGHFEPLRHYAEVHLIMEPGNRNSGVTFESKCHVDNLNIGHQNLVKTHIFEREHNGVLTGSQLTDVKITLIHGREHNKHTSGGDFREATYRALRQGLEKANNILLEPYYKFKISVQNEHLGRVISDIQRLSGSFEAPIMKEDRVIITGRGPVKTFMDYSTEILTFTKGKGNISLIYDGYDICHNTEEVIEEINYKRNADIEYTSTSIFCSKGESYLREWDKADECMHCDLSEVSL